MRDFVFLDLDNEIKIDWKKPYGGGRGPQIFGSVYYSRKDKTFYRASAEYRTIFQKLHLALIAIAPFLLFTPFHTIVLTSWEKLAFHVFGVIVLLLLLLVAPPINDRMLRKKMGTRAEIVSSVSVLTNSFFQKQSHLLRAGAPVMAIGSLLVVFLFAQVKSIGNDLTRIIAMWCWLLPIWGYIIPNYINTYYLLKDLREQAKALFSENVVVTEIYDS